jgi:hypothetical protein
VVHGGLVPACDVAGASQATLHRALDHLRYSYRRPSAPAATEHFADLAYGVPELSSRALTWADVSISSTEWVGRAP